MKKAPPVEHQTPAKTTAQYVWTTLTALQQQAVERIVIRMCQELAAHWIGNKGGEHHADR